jgi:hypothetical protein
MAKRRKDPAGEMMPAGTEAKESYLADIPAVRSFENSCGSFAEMLYNLAKSNANRGGTNTITDANVNDAYRELTRPTNKNYVPVCLGEAMMIIGGALFGSLIFNYALECY